MKYKDRARLRVEIPGWGPCLVSVVSFEEALLTPEGNYTDNDVFVVTFIEEARYLDEQIFFYVDDGDIEREDLGDYVKNLL